MVLRAWVWLLLVVPVACAPAPTTQRPSPRPSPYVADADPARCSDETGCELPNALAGCFGAVCRIVRCEEGRGDCDGRAENGCEGHLCYHSHGYECEAACRERHGYEF
jgi:hypothetical protein